ncbi:acyltransferase [Nocardiopsis tropica]|uniref:Acyltransferase n=1 Tax=Nocardiopsis tropica TaxID=109330 RepID=A0ABU7KM43_9ACTN|nr:acyltransferase [Nocardiopsis umidischolae]MEE2049752.1 acyltransferase [Nocardiopsis umidischolae]
MTANTEHVNWSSPLRNRSAELDGLRGLAVLAMLLQHVQAIPPLMDGRSPTGLIDTAFLQGVNSMWVLLDAFFVLSGFLTACALLGRGATRSETAKFWVRRLFRLVPLYYLFLVLYLYVFTFADTPQSDWEQNFEAQGWFWTFLSNNYMAATDTFAGPLSSYWFVAVDMQATVVLTVLILLLPRKWLIRAALVGITLVILSRVVLLAAGLPELSVYRFTTSRLDGFFVGLIIGVLAGRADAARFLPAARRTFVGGLALLGLLIVAFGSLRPGHVVDSWENPVVVALGFTVCAVTWGALIFLVAIGEGPRRLLRFRPFVSAGKYSYGMFLSNLFVMGVFFITGFSQAAVSEWFGGIPLLGILVYGTVMLTVSYLVGVLTYHGFERWTSQVGQRLSRKMGAR